MAHHRFRLKSHDLSFLTIATSLAIACLCSAAANAGGTRTKVALLNQQQEVSVTVASTASGCASFTINTNSNTLDYYIVFTGLTSAENGAHIHGPAGPGVNAGVLYTLPAGNPKSGTINYNEVDEAALLSGLTYVNIHSALNSGGEIRGQIVDLVAQLDSFQENPSTGETSTGWGLFNLDTCTNELDYHIVVDSLSSKETNAHIHGIAMPGENAGALHTLPKGSPKTGTWNYNESQEAGILGGCMYVNVHSAKHKGGEIRGQMVRTVTPMDEAQAGVSVGPPDPVGTAYISDAFNTLGYVIYYRDLGSAENNAHIHGYCDSASSCGVVHPLAAGQPKKGTWAYGAANASNIANGLTYINIHTVNNGGGEIRGQIFPALNPCFADLNCSGSVNVDDLLMQIGAWGPCPANPNPCNGDLIQTGSINVDDLLKLIGSWGKCP